MIVVTGGNGFIGKNLVQELSIEKRNKLIVLDINDKSLFEIYQWLIENACSIDVSYHLGAITDTTVMDEKLFYTYNFQFLYGNCVQNTTFH